MLQTYQPKRHEVVTKELLLSLANEQQPRRKRKRNINSLDQVQEIRLEYRSILKIDCLWPLSNLVKLKLNNNDIEKIENLDSLVHLCELDLSFNKIKKIENLDNLKMIHVLSLYANEIEVVEGLDSMAHLSILSLGKNSIFDLEHVLYLRKFKELQSLQMVGNPCTERSGYTSYLLAFVPQLVYYGYKMISSKQREDAAERHRRALANVLEAEAKKQKELEVVQHQEDKVAQLSKSYVEYLDEDCLFDLMYENDDDGKILAKLNQETEAANAQYRQRFSAVCHELFELGLKEDQKRRAEIDALNSVVEASICAATTKARKIMDSVQSKRAEISVRITQMLREAAISAEDADLDDETIDQIDKLAKQLSNEFQAYVNNVWKKLMREETLLHEQIEEMSKMFEININDMVSAFLELAQDFFARLRSLETEYNETLVPIVVAFLGAVDEEDKTPFLISIIDDKDAFNNCLAGSHFSHLQVIDDRQDRMLNRLKDWQATFLKNLVDDEIERSRSRILEISHYLNYHRENATVAKILGQQSSQLEHLSEDHEEDLEEDQDEAKEALPGDNDSNVTLIDL
ncbi:hypothetical protein TKK_0006946 [Trichogramma kaykai]|uniref:Dynein axonemal assembly factor 1 homolog n=1 Tax=Trichogramma kaykai TaxID=54128 RepID=A0ABD2XA73_9HYME